MDASPAAAAALSTRAGWSPSVRRIGDFTFSAVTNSGVSSIRSRM